KLFLGEILGLGSEGNLGPDRITLLHHRVARTSRRLVDRIRSCRRQRGLFSRGLDGVVRRQLCSWKRIAQLRLRYWRRNLRRNFRRRRSAFCRIRDLALSLKQASSNHARGTGSGGRVGRLKRFDLPQMNFSTTNEFDRERKSRYTRTAYLAGTRARPARAA